MRPKTTDRDIGMHTFTVEIVLEAQTLKNSDELCQLFVHIQQWTAQKYKYKYQNGDELCPSCVQIQLMTAHKYGGDLLIGRPSSFDRELDRKKSQKTQKR